MSTFLFNLHGHHVAFRRTQEDKFLFDKHGHWLGWFPWGDNDAVDKTGKYLGTVVGNRLLRRTFQPYRGYPGYPGYPGYAGYPGYPGFAGYAGYQAGFTDVDAAQFQD
ncbi:hypothetical protein GCM10025867_08740 [Frondihabitans sucicola]|uniref:Uncharacterized protein n=1 Tax=Frondihabitans sucicola TaxID=1268041 RepID=A0ABM8GJQ1_9MICO|nr:hypothetical protein [Frondihabitans sucicola]BDZ48633.1 hypothetical protein GCM10025867_08740 [Frondihabitans sucicola]